jgi:hypothetical protein
MAIMIIDLQTIVNLDGQNYQYADDLSVELMQTAVDHFNETGKWSKSIITLSPCNNKGTNIRVSAKKIYESIKGKTGDDTEDEEGVKTSKPAKWESRVVWGFAIFLVLAILVSILPALVQWFH